MWTGHLVFLTIVLLHNPIMLMVSSVMADPNVAKCHHTITAMFGGWGDGISAKCCICYTSDIMGYAQCANYYYALFVVHNIIIICNEITSPRAFFEK